MTNLRAIGILQSLIKTVIVMYNGSENIETSENIITALFKAIDALRWQGDKMTLEELEKKLDYNSDCVFYDNDHGYCINTETAMSLFSQAQTEVISKSEAYAVARHINDTLLDVIRDDGFIDNLAWLQTMVHAYEKLCQYSGYTGEN